MLVTKALSQDVMLLAFVPLFARSRFSGQHDVGHGGVITGCDAFILRSSIADHREVAQSPFQSTTIYREKRNLIIVYLCESETSATIFHFSIYIFTFKPLHSNMYQSFSFLRELLWDIR